MGTNNRRGPAITDKRFGSGYRAVIGDVFAYADTRQGAAAACRDAVREVEGLPPISKGTPFGPPRHNRRFK